MRILDGERFDRLLVGHLSHRKKRNGKQGYRKYWKCKCDCGKEVTVEESHLLYGHTRSCGCLAIDILKRRSITHNKRHSKVYGVWASMNQRCNDSGSPAYKNYGGRGIKVHERWKTFENFFEDMGEPKIGDSIERVNNDEGYCKENCKWIKRKDQSRNRRNSVFFSIDGEKKLVVDWLRKYGLNRGTFNNRIKRGWSMYDAITKEVDKTKRNRRYM